MRLEDLEYVGVVGEGSFCRVSKYRDPRSGVFYAVKKLIPELQNNLIYVERFRKEMQYLIELEACDNIIEVIEHNDSDEVDKLYLLMPCADENLQEYIGVQNAKLSFDVRCHIFEQISDAIKFAHNKSILHRDLAPSNILLFEDNGQINVKVSDFGLGKDLSKASKFTKTSPNQYGHFYYCAPEQLEDLRNASEKSDIYSLGCVCYFIFTGEHPIIPQHFDLSTLFKKATSPVRDDRHATVQEFEDHYKSLKKMVLTRSDPNRYVSLKKFLKQPGPLDLHQLHEKLIEKRQYTDIALDFLFPVTQYFLGVNNLANYHKMFGDNIHSFVENFSTYYHELPTFGWDFRDLDHYGKLLIDIIELVDFLPSKLLCYKMLLEMAYYYNCFSIQNKLKNVFIEKLIPEGIEVQLAEFIESNSFNLEEKHFNLDETPVPIRTIILEKIRMKKEEEEEYRKRMKNMDLDI